MKSMRLAVVVLSIALAAPLFAATGEKFKDWEKSPQAYFMTQAEHQQWSAIRTPEEAQQFIDNFLAKRGPKFPTEVADRAAQADKYLTIGKLPGSQTLRGKLVILLGPPSQMDVFQITDNSGIHRDNPTVAGAYSGGTQNNANEDMAGGHEGSSSMGGAKLLKNYHLTYASTPSGPLEVTITADADTGKDRPRSRDDSKRLDAAFEAAAQASIKTK
jgi:GWxTD domain-containing protein